MVYQFTQFPVYTGIVRLPLYSTSDKLIRPFLLEKLSHIYHNEPTAYLQEFEIANTGTRADLVVANGILHGYEVKSDIDSLTRLPKQIDGYNAVFDKVTLVVGTRHLYHAIRVIPDWWGIDVVVSETNKKVCISTLRESENNPDPNIAKILGLLSKLELLELSKTYLQSLSLSGKSKREIISILIDKFDHCLIKNYVRNKIKMRFD